MQADGSGAMRITHNKGGNYAPSWSPDGTELCFQSTRTGRSRIYLMRADGSGQVALTHGSGNDFVPRFAPATKF